MPHSPVPGVASQKPAAMPQPIVIDTNIALDLLVFADPRTQALHQALVAGDLQWMATATMRDELAHVLNYPHIVRQMQKRNVQAHAVQTAWNAWVQLQPAAVRASLTCRDADDQMFLDLALAFHCPLLSKDAEVLRLRRPLAGLGVPVATQWPLPQADRPGA